MAGVLAPIILILAVLCLRARHAELRGPALLAVVATAVEALPGVTYLHALAAPVLFTCIAAIAAFSPRRTRIAAAGTPLLRKLASALPPLILFEIALGIYYRNPGGAILVAGPVSIVCLTVFRRNPRHPSLRPRVLALVSILLARMFFGAAVFAMRLPDIQIAAVTGILGSLTLAAGTLFAKEYRRVTANA